MTTSSPAFDPTNLDDIRDRLIETLSSHHPGISLSDGPDQFRGGLDTYVYGVRFAGDLPSEWAAPLVLRIYPVAAQAAKAQREAAIQSFVVGHGFPAPSALFVEPHGGAVGLPFMLMERVAGEQAIKALKNPLILPGMIRGMAALHARLHNLPTEDCPLPYESPLVDRLLAEPRGYIGRFDPPGLAKVLARLEAHVDIVRDETPSLVHLDFHPMNILADGDRMSLIDWADATRGDRHSDVARTLALFWLAVPLLENPVERTLLSVLRRYLVPAYKRAYRAHLPLDDARLRYWEALHAFRAWTQIAVLKQEGEEAIGARLGMASAMPASVLPAFQAYVAQRVKAFR